MIYSIGIDVVESERIAAAFHRYGDRFMRRIYTAGEADMALARGSDAMPFLAGRFAAKEAVMKALGRFFDRDVALRDIEISAVAGRPTIILGRYLRESLTGKRILISIAHTERYALAAAVITDEE